MKNPVIGIIGGKGRMGRLFAEFFHDRGIKVLISDKNTKLTNKKLVQDSDIIIISVPIDLTEKVIKEIIPYIKKDSLLTDFTSVKEVPVNAMLKANCEVLGMHPMFGNSNPIPGQTVILCPTKKSGKYSIWLEKFLKENGANIKKMTPEKHDKIMNLAQGLIHFAEITFADAIRRCSLPVNELLKYTGKASELKVQLAARLIDQDAGLYGNIQIQNKNALKSLIEYKKSVDKLIDIVKKKNLDEFKKYFNQNQKFLGKYTHQAYKDSSYLIDKLVELQSYREKGEKPFKLNKNDIATLGPKNTFSNIAAIDYLKKIKSNKNIYFAKDFEELFDLVEQGKISMGIVPIENKLNGTIRETLDALFYRKIYINDEINIQIKHNLITLPHTKITDIKKIVSHPQALAQCKKFIKKNFPKVEIIPLTSTSAAVQKLIISNDKYMAVIAPDIAAKEENLKIIKANIHDSADNSTTFVVIKKGVVNLNSRVNKQEVILKNKTSIAFHFDKDSPGSLFEVFKEFAQAKINLTKIESRPANTKFGDYIFYLDFEGSISDSKTQKTLKEVNNKVAKLKILGSY